MAYLGKSLTLVAFLDVFFGVGSHCWPVISDCDGFFCQTSRSGMVAAFPFVKFVHDVARFLIVESSHVWSG